MNDRLGSVEAEFIQACHRFHMACVNDTGWPHIQCRTGPVGFVKVLDEKRLVFVEHRANEQSISKLMNNDKVSLFFMGHSNQAGLTLRGRVAPFDEARASGEQGSVIHIDGFDWSCPTDIGPCDGAAQFDGISANNIAQSSVWDRLSYAKEASFNQAPPKLGQGPLSLVVSGIRQLTPEIRAFEFKSADTKALPQVSAGSHIRLPVMLNDGSLVHRSYSICSNPSRRHFYEIAVLAKVNQGEPQDADITMSASHTLHQTYQLGTVVECDMPENRLEAHSGCEPAVLIAAGVGITVIKPVSQYLKSRGVRLSLHYSGRSMKDMAFRDRLEREFGESISVYPSDEDKRLDLKLLLTTAAKNSIFYICGPQKMLAEMRLKAEELGIDAWRIKSEAFNERVDLDKIDRSTTAKLA